jgi:hypothetical protein
MALDDAPQLLGVKLDNGTRVTHGSGANVKIPLPGSLSFEKRTDGAQQLVDPCLSASGLKVLFLAVATIEPALRGGRWRITDDRPITAYDAPMWNVDRMARTCRPQERAATLASGKSVICAQHRALRARLAGMALWLLDPPLCFDPSLSTHIGLSPQPASGRWIYASVMQSSHRQQTLQ